MTFLAGMLQGMTYGLLLFGVVATLMGVCWLIMGAVKKNSETGQWTLPWIRKVFFEDGVQVANFYTRGISVSAPSWSA